MALLGLAGVILPDLLVSEVPVAVVVWAYVAWLTQPSLYSSKLFMVIKTS